MAVLRNFVAIAALILQASFTVATFPHYNRQLSIPSWNYTASDSVQPTIVQTQVTAHNNTLTTASSTRSDSLITPTNQSTAAQSSPDPSGQSTLSSLSAIPSLPSTVAGTGQASISISITPSSISTAPSTQVSVPPTSDIVVSSTSASQDFGQPSSQPTGPSSSVPIATSQASTQLGTELTGALSEPSVSTTITSLPTGARVETLTGIGFTEGTIITTTSSGSSEPTVVPVIVPASGPPKICWGCVPSFPADIQIKVPEFCVNIFGFKIGNCPPNDDDDDSSDGDNDDGDDDDDDEDDPDKENSTNTEPTQTGTATPETSCTTTVTATYESVFCSVTAAADARKRQETTSCSTLAYSTTSACDLVTGTTTTTTLAETATGILCGASGCGNNCIEKRDLERRVAPPRDTEPAPNTWADPSNYGGDRQKFMRGEVARAYQDPGQSVQLGFTPGEVGSEFTTTNWISFSNTVRSLAVSGLWGCTAVVVVSEQGAWAGHFWEQKSFHDPMNFEIDVLFSLWVGKGTQWEDEYGVNQLRNNPEVPPGHIFDDVNNPRIFIMTPRNTYDWDTDENAGGDSVRYSGQIDRVQDTLRDIFNRNMNIDISIIQYAPLREGPDGKGDQGYNSHRGKLLVQYQPAAQACQANADGADQPQAKWRVWVDGRELGDRHAEWVPSNTQHLKRKESCPIDADGSDSSTQVDTISQTATTTQTKTSTQTATGSISSSSLPETSSQTRTSQISTPTETQGACQMNSDCGAMVCTGHTVQTCSNGKCVCDSPPAAESECSADSDCEASLTCLVNFEKKCYGGQCVCLPQSTTTTTSAEATTAAQPTQTDTAPPPEETLYTCNLHLHEYAQSNSDTSIVVDYTFDNGKGDKPFEGSFTKNWGEEYQVPTTETGLSKSITVKLSTELPPGMADIECPEDSEGGGGGGRGIYKRCADTQWVNWMIQLSYGDLDWNSRPDQDISKTPHCQKECIDRDRNGDLAFLVRRYIYGNSDNILHRHRELASSMDIPDSWAPAPSSEVKAGHE